MGACPSLTPGKAAISWAQGAALNLPATRSYLGGAWLCRTKQAASVLRPTTQTAPGFHFPRRKVEANLAWIFLSLWEALRLCAGEDGRWATSESLNQGNPPRMGLSAHLMQAPLLS